MILYFCEGYFIYTLDDPYIHLALAKNISLGHYGINLSEYSSPSSSILWPFLLVPFAFLDQTLQYIPLAINLISALFTIYCLKIIFQDQSPLKQSLLIFIILFSLNIYGLVFSGMEHNLHIAIISLTAVGLLRPELLANNQFKLIFFVSLILAPTIRFESLAITVPFLTYLYSEKKYKQEVIISSLILVAIMICYGLYMYSLGLDFLPQSVMAKSVESQKNYALYLMHNLQKLRWIIIIPLGITLLFPDLKQRPLLLSVSFTSILYVLAGKSVEGLFRHEIFIVYFAALCILHVVQEYSKNIAIFIFILPLVCIPYIQYSLTTHQSSAAIYDQQFQMTKIIQNLDSQKVAINDLGLIAYYNNDYILDIYGLASKEALTYRKENTTPDWMNILRQKHDIKYAFIYKDWFNKDIPENWIQVGTLECLKRHGATTAFNKVNIYATDKQYASNLKTALDQYNASLSNVSKKRHHINILQ